MIALTYHPAFDAFHAIFRFLRIKASGNIQQIEVDKIRILDYYLLFPWRAASIKLSQTDLEVRRLAKKLEVRRDYATLPAGETLLERMRASQIAALQTMAQDTVVDAEALRKGTVVFLNFSIPANLKQKIEERNRAEADALKIIESLNKYSLLGIDGLKGRTTLLEHRYDKI